MIFGAVFINNEVESVIWKYLDFKNQQMVIKRMSVCAQSCYIFQHLFPACLSVVRRWENLLKPKCVGWADRSYERAHIRLNLLKNYFGL